MNDCCENCEHCAVLKKGATYQETGRCCTLELDVFKIKYIYEVIPTDRCEMFVQKGKENGNVSITDKPAY